MIVEVVNNWRTMLQMNILKKKLDFEPKSPSVTGNVCYHYNTCVTGVYMAYMFDKILEEEHLKLSDYLNQI